MTLMLVLRTACIFIGFMRCLVVIKRQYGNYNHRHDGVAKRHLASMLFTFSTISQQKTALNAWRNANSPYNEPCV